jgi:hypothetical protein
MKTTKWEERFDKEEFRREFFNKSVNSEGETWYFPKPIPEVEWESFIQELLDSQRAKYQELIMAVESKHEGETRHETALRYIKQAECGSNEAVKDIPGFEGTLEQLDKLTRKEEE